jgi:DNA-binding XRE family transcriptional regulator
MTWQVMDPRRTWRHAHCPCPSPDETRRRPAHTRCPNPALGPLLREWRARRRVSQMDLALDVGVSTRHLSFIETGRSRPSPAMLLALAEQLQVPLRERNRLLLAAGYAPRYAERPLDAPAMEPVRRPCSGCWTRTRPTRAW